MAIKPILFNTEMVRAILDGRKSCTRRLVKPEPQGYFEVSEEPLYIYDTDGNQGKITPPYQPSDILYVRESYSELTFGYVYKADGENIDHLGNVIKWHPSIHMPKEAARMQDLQDIRDGIEISHASDDEKQKKEAKKEKRKLAKQKNIERLEKKIIEVGYENLAEHSVDRVHADKWLTPERLEELEQIRQQKIKEEQEKPVQLSLFGMM